MLSRILTGLALCGACVLGYALGTPHEQARAADAPTNLQVLPKDMSRKDVKDIMKKMSKALGVKCRHCHDTDDYAADTPDKKVAREMMRMTQEINGKYLQEEGAVTCMTCHKGKKHPEK